MTEFEWDPEKDRLNRRKHGIGFAEAVAIFNGTVLDVPDDRDHGEVRWLSYGFLGNLVVVCVVRTDRNGKTRIVSARKATRFERRRFNEHLEKTAG